MFKSIAQQHFLFANRQPGHAANGPAGQPMNLNLKPKNSFDAPKWATNPWSEMLKRKGIPQLNKINKGF